MWGRLYPLAKNNVIVNRIRCVGGVGCILSPSEEYLPVLL